MAQLLAAPYSYFADSNGAPLSGGKVYTYVAGSGYATPKASYTDSTGGVSAANPVVLDSGGKAEIWLSGSYGIVVKDSLSNTIHSTDNITPAGSSSGSSFVDNVFQITDNGDATKIIAFEASGITTGTTRTITMPDKNGTLAMLSDISGKITTKQFTDTTDISLSANPTQANVGAAASISIPTKGLLIWVPTFEMISATGTNDAIWGIRIGSTNYWPLPTFGGVSTRALASCTDSSSGPGTSIMNAFGVLQQNIGSNVSAPPGMFMVGIGIEANSVPTGTQTVQPICSKGNSGGSNALTIKGTVVTTRFNLIIVDCT